MDRLGENPTLDLDKTIREWLIRSLTAREPTSSYREAITAVIDRFLPESVTTPGKGKKLSYLPLPGVCCQALGKVSDLTIAVNAVWILHYIASYLLDKIEDQEYEDPIFDNFRVGAIANVTTGLFLHAGWFLADLEFEDAVQQATANQIRKAIYRHGLEVCRGQHLDLTLHEPTLEEVWQIIEGKSGKFFAIGAMAGAMCATSQPEYIDLFMQYGRRLGILVQIGNDIGGLGKDEVNGSDLRAGKRTLPVLYALNVLPVAQRQRLEYLLIAALTDHSAEIEARNVIISTGAVVYLALEGEKHKQQAKKIIDQMPLQPGSVLYLMSILDHAISTKRYFKQYTASRP